MRLCKRLFSLYLTQYKILFMERILMNTAGMIFYEILCCSNLSVMQHPKFQLWGVFVRKENMFCVGQANLSSVGSLSMCFLAQPLVRCVYQRKKSDVHTQEADWEKYYIVKRLILIMIIRNTGYRLLFWQQISEVRYDYSESYISPIMAPNINITEYL